MLLSKMKAFEFPQGPFLTEDFSPRGGGIDFLGLRLINLRILGQDLIPELNNVTGDFGNFCVAAWIPWKFQRVYQKKLFTEENFSKFSEAVEVGMGFCQRDASPASHKFGPPHRKIGVDQNKKLKFPCDLRFKTVDRTDATSLYAAPLYGPSVRYLGLIKGFCLGEDGHPTRIPGAGEDPETTAIVEFVDQALSESGRAEAFQILKIPKAEGALMDQWGL